MLKRLPPSLLSFACAKSFQLLEAQARTALPKAFSWRFD